jgi:hypothetical protein
MKTFENFEIKPVDVPVMAWVSIDRHEDGQVEINFHPTKELAEKNINPNDTNQFVYKTEFQMTMIDDKFVMNSGKVYDGGWDNSDF